jgi:hypothetical protein
MSKCPCCAPHPPPPPLPAAIVVHGTSGLVVQDNVGFHIDGHAVYLEVGPGEAREIEPALYLH